MKLLPAWIASLSIITSLVILQGTSLATMVYEWPLTRLTRHAMRPIETPITLPTYSAETLREWTFQAAEKCQVPAPLLFRQVQAESGFRWNAISSSGAIGLLQVKQYHAGPLLDLMDPETNLNLGACLLRRHFDRMHSWRLALEAYHGGQFRIQTSNETREYARMISKDY